MKTPTITSVIASASEAIQKHGRRKWIASSHTLPAMTANVVTMTAEIVEAKAKANVMAMVAAVAAWAAARARRRHYGPRSSSRRGLRRSPHRS